MDSAVTVQLQIVHSVLLITPVLRVNRSSIFTKAIAIRLALNYVIIVMCLLELVLPAILNILST